MTGELLAGLITVAIGLLAIRYHAQVSGGFRRANEWTYRRLPERVGRPMMRVSPTFHSAMAYVIFAWGVLCVLTGAVIAVYALAG